MTQPVSSSAASPPAEARPVRGGALDALRFVAAMFVVVFHFGDEAPVALSSLHGMMGRGYLATDFFLILSGFVLAKAYGPAVIADKISLGRFWLKRFVRCYPTHLITLGLLVLMVGGGALVGIHAADSTRFDWAGLPYQIFLLHAFGLGGGHWNIPSWTISTLLICYLFFPMLWRRMARFKRPAAAIALGLLILVVADLLSLWLLGTAQFNLPFQWSFFRAAPLFLVGLTLGAAIKAARWSPRQAGAIGWTSGVVLLANASVAGPDFISILAICGIIMGCGASPARHALPGAAWGAKVSFCLFMVHTLTGAVWFDAVEPLALQLFPALNATMGLWALWFGSLIATVLGSWAYCAWIDEPVVEWLNKKLFSKPEKLKSAARPVPHPVTETSA